MGSPAIEVKCGDGIWCTREKGLKANVICYILIISIIVGLFAYFTQNQVYAYNQKTGIVKVDDALNVRTGPGTGYSKLTSNGTNVKLTNGTKVTIQDEAYAADGAKWYKISFSYKGVHCPDMHTVIIFMSKQELIILRIQILKAI